MTALQWGSLFLQHALKQKQQSRSDSSLEILFQNEINWLELGDVIREQVSDLPSGSVMLASVLCAGEYCESALHEAASAEHA